MNLQHTAQNPGHGRAAEDVPWWREHVAYAVWLRRDMRRDHAVVAVLVALSVAGGAAGAAAISWWLLGPVAAVATVFLGTEVREWAQSERNIARSLRSRRAGLAEAERAEAARFKPGFEDGGAWR